jgi:choline monooxygenase
MHRRVRIDSDIRRATTLPASFYTDRERFARLRESVFAHSWQFVGDELQVTAPGDVLPFELLPGSLDEPLLLARGLDGTLRCLSNVCTHRGNLLRSEAGNCRKLRCRYHGRRFGLDGRFEFMPEFEQAADFPRPDDDLPQAALGSLDGLLFAGLQPVVDFAAWIGPLRERIGFLPLSQFRAEPAHSHDYRLAAHWALYVDNYLEGFHIPYVHPDLAKAVDYESYETELFAWGNVQIARAGGSECRFDGSDIAAYYFWLFPNTMLNFYPWGLSVNVVQPLDLDSTRVLFRSYVWRPELLGRGAGGALDRVELEDEAVVEAVQRGIRSRLYRQGRFSPARERGVHQFHRLLSGMGG